jgi:hypothetical protein
MKKNEKSWSREHFTIKDLGKVEWSRRGKEIRYGLIDNIIKK